MPPGLQRMQLPSCPPPESLRLGGRSPQLLNRELGKRTPSDALVVAPLHPHQVHHTVHHGALDVLALAGLLAMQQRREDAERQMNPGAGVADLGSGHDRGAVEHPRRAHRAAHRLCDVLVGLEGGIGTFRAEALDGSHYHARVDLLHPLPSEPEPVQNPRAEVLHEHVALLHQPGEDLLSALVLEVHRDRALVAVEHGEVEAVGVRDIAQLLAGGVPEGRLQLDHVRPHERQQLAGGGPRLDVSHVQNADAVECFAH